mgnify:CR=1 FL=1
MYERFQFNLENTSFEWDEEKERINFRKHGIHFATAAKVFLDPNKLIREDEEHPRRRFGMISSAKWERYCLLSVHSEKAI